MTLPSTLQLGQAHRGAPGLSSNCWNSFRLLSWILRIKLRLLGRIKLKPSIEWESLLPLFLCCPRLVWTRVIRAAGILLGIITNSLSALHSLQPGHLRFIYVLERDKYVRLKKMLLVFLIFCRSHSFTLITSHRNTLVNYGQDLLFIKEQWTDEIPHHNRPVPAKQ